MEATKKVFVTLNLGLINYATRIGGGNLSIGINKILTEYREADIDNISQSDQLADAIASAPVDVQRPVAQSVLDQLAALNSEAEVKAVEDGKVMVEVANNATLYEFSKYNYVLQGDTKPEPIRNYLKGLDAKFQQSCNKLAGAAVWRISKKSIENMTVEKLIADLAELGLNVCIGQSLYTDEERQADAEKSKSKSDEKPVEKPTEPVNIISMGHKADMNGLTEIVGIAHNLKAKESDVTFTEIPTLRHDDSNFSAYFSNDGGKEKVYIFTGYDEQGEAHFFFMGNAKTLDGKALAKGGTLENHDAVKMIAQEGLAFAFESGVVKKVYPYQIEAYADGGDTAVAEWLKENAA